MGLKHRTELRDKGKQSTTWIPRICLECNDAAPVLLYRKVGKLLILLGGNEYRSGSAMSALLWHVMYLYRLLPLSCWGKVVIPHLCSWVRCVLTGTHQCSDTWVGSFLVLLECYWCGRLMFQEKRFCSEPFFLASGGSVSHTTKSLIWWRLSAKQMCLLISKRLCVMECLLLT